MRFSLRTDRSCFAARAPKSAAACGAHLALDHTGRRGVARVWRWDRTWRLSLCHFDFICLVLKYGREDALTLNP